MNKSIAVNMELEKVSAERITDIEGRFNQTMMTTIAFIVKNRSSDYRGIKIIGEIDIKPTSERFFIKHIKCTVCFTILLNEATNDAEINEFMGNQQDLTKEFLPFIDSFISGLTKSMNITPLILSGASPPPSAK